MLLLVWRAGLGTSCEDGWPTNAVGKGLWVVRLSGLGCCKHGSSAVPVELISWTVGGVLM